MKNVRSFAHASVLVAYSLLLAAVASVRADDLQPSNNRTQADFQAIEGIIARGIEEGQMPGAVVVIADDQQILYQRAFGHRQIEPEREPMTMDTVFDLASLTKPVATATSVMRLIQAGKLDPEAPVSKYLPEFGDQGKDSITVADLLLHVGGLIPDNALRDYQDGGEKSWQRICELKPVANRGEEFKYTDVGFIVLGKLVERVSGVPLDQFAKREIFEPLGMTTTTFNPDDTLCLRAAPTEQRNGEWMRGEVHDPRAYLMDGVAGHAGLFSTAGDLVRYGQAMLRNGSVGDVVVLEEPTFRLMTKPRQVPRGSRTFGWDHQSPYSSNRGESLSTSAFGHGGFTGTAMWIDPGKNRVVVFLSNRLHPDGKGSVNRLAGEVATLVGNATEDSTGSTD
ncbi:MAG: serine hydrolase domain-containing protein [Rubripirellula sp.]